MVKRILVTLLQFAVFLALLFLGGYWDNVNLSYEMYRLQHGIPLSQVHPILTTIKFPLGSHILIAEGFFFATALLVLILLFEALRRRLRPWAGLTFLAYVCAMGLALALKLGLPPA